MVAVTAIALTIAARSGADARCSQGEVRADRALGPMVGFLPAPRPTETDRAIARSRVREIAAMIAPYRHGVDPPRDIARYTAPGMLATAQSPAALKERGPRYLLYRVSERAIQLEGAEFTFARDTPVRELNAILPMAVARWHQTTYHCTAPPGFMWIATVFPYAHGDGAIWRRLEVLRYVEIAPRLATPARSAPRASR